MEDSFDFGKLLKKHKSKPLQFSSVAGGVKKRLDKNIKYRKSSRLSVFDNLRNLSKSDSPVPVVNLVQCKVDHRRQQLEKWKEEKEKKKKEAALKKKKPFIAGVAHASLKYVPPPPPRKPIPSSSGMVTRSQSARTATGVKPKETKEAKAAPRSFAFAPKNASFKPPEIKTLMKLPKLGPAKTNKHNITFDPVLPSAQKETAKQTRCKAVKQTAIGTNAVCKQTERPTKGKVTKLLPNITMTLLQSSSSSEIEQNNDKKPPILTSKNLRKSLSPLNSPKITSKTPRKSVEYVTPNRSHILLPRSESSSEERLRVSKSLDDFDLTPEQIEVVKEAKNSPFVTVSRGKDNARKERIKKLDEGLLDEDTSDIDSVDSVDDFRRQLASEIKRMTEMCDTWDKIMEQTVLSESVQEAVLSAVGQARLLMSQKMQQFASLVERCARPEPGSALITRFDLHGFWDMVYMQVENVNMRFKKLEELRLCGWVEDQPVEVKKKVVRPTANVKKAAKPTGGPSRLREMIAAARKAKKEQEEATVILEPASADSKTFEAGFFSVSSPVRSPASATDTPTRAPGAKSSLLKSVLSSEAKKASANKNSTSFAMLRASVFGKNMECDGFSLLPQTPIMTPINLHATPGRSILKNTSTEKKSTKKSIKMVLFNQSDADIQDISYHTPDSEVKEQKTEEIQSDCGISSMDLEKVENKENSRRRSKLVQDTENISSAMVTRSRRKSMNTTQDDDHDAATTRRSARKKVLHESEDNVAEEKTKRSTRKRK